MRFTSLTTLATLGLAAASPISRRMMSGSGMNSSVTNSSSPSLETILQYALTLEHLEATFYKEGLMNYTASDFQNAGFPDWVRKRTEEIHSHEQSHVALLTNALSALGASPNSACTYNFPSLTSSRSSSSPAASRTSASRPTLAPCSTSPRRPTHRCRLNHRCRGPTPGVFYGPVLLQSGWT